MALETSIGPHKLYASDLKGFAARYSKDAEKIARAFHRTLDKRIQSFLADFGLAKTIPAKQALIDGLFPELEQIGLKFFGPDSIFEAKTTLALAQAKKAGVTLTQTQIGILDAAAEKALALKLADFSRGMILTAKDSFTLLSKNLIEDSVNEVRRLVVEEMAMGEGTEALARKLRKSGIIPDLVKKDGKTLRAATRCNMIARTEINRAANGAYLESNRLVEGKEENRLYRWVSVLSPTSTPDSLVRHGWILSEKEWMTRDFGDGYFGLPPLRPNDQCSLIFYRKSWLSEEEQKQFGDGAPVPKDQGKAKEIVRKQKEAKIAKAQKKISEAFDFAKAQAGHFLAKDWRYKKREPGSWGPHLPDDDLSGIRAYTGQSFRDIRAVQRAASKRGSPGSGWLWDYAQGAERAVEKLPKFHGECFRTVGIRGSRSSVQDFISKHPLGSVYSEGALASASQNPERAMNFAKYTTVERAGVMLRIQAKGKRGSFVHKVSSHPGEDEITFSSKARFKVRGYRRVRYEQWGVDLLEVSLEEI